jgi:type I restriction enzyme, S subunit
MSDRHVKRYAAYKESGVEWIGEVPAHWELRRLKELGKIQNSNVDKKTYPDEKAVRLCNYVDVYKNEFINSHLLQEFMSATADEFEIKKFAVKENDVLITKDSETADDIAIPALVTETLDGVLCGYHLAQIRTNSKKLFGPYLFRLFQSNSYNSRFEVSAKGITRVGLGQSAISDALTSVPPLPEQTAIVAYLDTKTAQIDRQLELLSKKASQYGKLKQSLINETVTRGLDSTVPMKESGVEWIGEVPAHWKVKRVKGFVNFKKGKTPNDFSDDPKHLPYLSMEFLREKNSTVNYVIPQKNLVVIADGELLVLWDGANAGEILIGKKGYLSSTMAVIKAKASLLNKSFFFFFLKSLEKSFKDFSNGTTIPHFAPDVLTGEIFGIPPLPEQTAIAAYLDTKTAQIDRIVSTINIQIGKLKELRKTLINDVVTGKIKVIPEGELV